MPGRNTALACLIAIAALCRAVAAHPAHVQHGEVMLGEDRIDVHFAISEHDAQHMGMSIETIARDLINSLFLFDERGRRIERSEARIEKAGCLIVFPIVQGVDSITFQQRVESAEISRGRMLQLSMTRKNGGALPLMRLSAGGNAETIALKPVEANEFNDRVDRFHDILLIVEPAEQRVALELHVPATILETWIPLRRQSGDVLTNEELQRSHASIADWFSSRVSAESATLRINKIILLAPTINEIASVSLSSSEPEAESSDVGYWCARIAIQAELTSENKSNIASLRCGFFNSRVLAVKSVVRVNESTDRWVTLSTYDPVLEFDQAGEPAPSPARIDVNQ